MKYSSYFAHSKAAVNQVNGGATCCFVGVTNVLKLQFMHYSKICIFANTALITPGSKEYPIISSIHLGVDIMD